MMAARPGEGSPPSSNRSWAPVVATAAAGVQDRGEGTLPIGGDMATLSWRLHGDGRRVGPGEVVDPDERLSWPRTIGIGVQHVLAMFGATALVPILTGFPP